jgi:hypothetical protein
MKHAVVLEVGIRAATEQLIERRRLVLVTVADGRLAKEFPAFYGTQLFMTVATTARHLSHMLSQMNPAPHPHTVSFRPIDD